MGMSGRDLLRTDEKRCSHDGSPTPGRRWVTFCTQSCPPVPVWPDLEVTFPLASPVTSEIPLKDVQV